MTGRRPVIHRRRVCALCQRRERLRGGFGNGEQFYAEGGEVIDLRLMPQQAVFACFGAIALTIADLTGSHPVSHTQQCDPISQHKEPARADPAEDGDGLRGVRKASPAATAVTFRVRRSARP
jgi:hypothetical protein